MTHGAVLVLAATLCACGGLPDLPVADAKTQIYGTGSARSGGSGPIDPVTVATIKGRVLYTKGVPRLRKEQVAEKYCRDFYGSKGIPKNDLVVATDGGMKWAFVHVKEGVQGYDMPAPPSTPVVLDQKGCRYEPHVFGIRVGQTLIFRNSDPIMHNIRTNPLNNAPDNVAQNQKGAEHPTRFRRPEVMLRIGCDVHGWMESFAGVLDHPFFAVTKADGSFEIGGLPPGVYLVEAWHEQLGAIEMEVEVAANETKDVKFEYPGK